MGDEEIIRRRLLIDGEGTGDARMMTKFTKSLVKWCFSEDNPEESQLQYERLLTSLASVEQSATKWDNILQMNSLQIQHYEEIKTETVGAVTDAQSELEGAKAELSKAREFKNHSLQYHALAKLIQEHPPRSPTAHKLENLSSSLEKCKASRNELDDKLNLRKKQLHVLFTALQQLQTSLAADQAKETEDQEDLEVITPVVDLTEEPIHHNGRTTITAPEAPSTPRHNGTGLVDLTGDGRYANIDFAL
uniref:THO complex subunit 7 homolog n=1 Tax=Hirondellea gigas TaxID=1518452 RepID=A0A2P2I2U6_9CRUS